MTDVFALDLAANVSHVLSNIASRTPTMGSDDVMSIPKGTQRRFDPARA